tara:strand:+ start:469 stop:645 length:177 start_codon:yes stop_codon:yes gene_type:complete
MSTKKEEEMLQQTFLEQLNTKEKIAYEIARDHLGSSFDLSLSIGYLEWKKTYKPSKKK